MAKAVSEVYNDLIVKTGWEETWRMVGPEYPATVGWKQADMVKEIENILTMYEPGTYIGDILEDEDSDSEERKMYRADMKKLQRFVEKYKEK